MDTKNRKIFNDTVIETEEPALMKIKQDTAKFVAGTLGKHKYSSKGDEAMSKIADKITGMQITIDGTTIQDKKSKTT